MTVGELKKLLSGVPDDMPVLARVTSPWLRYADAQASVTEACKNEAGIWPKVGGETEETVRVLLISEER